jgi:radical SAM superfamily enzyme
METPGAPARAAKLLNEYGIKGSKLHQLMILKGTRLADYWQNKPFPLLTLDEYIDRVTEFLAELNPAIYIERLYAIASVLERCLAPEWSRRRWWTHNHLQAELQRRGIKQGQRLL